MRRVEAVRVAALLGALGAVACAPARCPPPAVRLPATRQQLGWSTARAASAQAFVNGAPASAVLDTAYPRSAVSLDAASHLPRAGVALQLGDATAGPASLDVATATPSDVELVIGADVLHQLPLALDARARTTDLPSAFSEPAPDAAPLSVWDSGLCRGDRAANGPEGPFLLIASVLVEGTPHVFALDTGTEVTLVRTSVFAALGGKVTLDGVRLATAFGGTLSTSARRAREVSAAAGTSAWSLVLSAPGIDSELDALQDAAGSGRACPGPQACEGRVTLDGLLGWTFLREFRVALDARGAQGERFWHLSRFDTQSHWTRELIGIGLYTSASALPGALRVEGLLRPSPASQAGIAEGDELLAINGVPAAQVSTPYGPPGTTLACQLSRQGALYDATLTVSDLLPDG